MNCEQANQIPLDTVVKSMGYAALNKHSGGAEQWYENPLRTERTPSFSVNHKKNVWQDLGTGEGGTVIDLVMKFTHTGVTDALAWLSEHIGGTSVPKKQPPYSMDKFEEKKSRFEVLNDKPIAKPALQQYTEQRGISLPFAQEHLREVRYLDTETNKEYFGLGMKNNSGGWAIRNKYMKTVIAPNGFTVVQGNGSKSNTINVFEGMFDFLSYLEMTGNKTANMQSLILHSTNMAKQATTYLNKEVLIAHVVLWLDNEPEGSKANEAVQRATDYFTALPQAIYDAKDTFYGFNDLNASWMATRDTRIEMRPIKRRDDTGDMTFLLN